MSLIIRHIEECDYEQVENLARESFWNVYRPGCNEHLLVHNIHQLNKSIEGLELIALYDNKIVGHIVYTKGSIEDTDSEGFISFGPLSVLPEFQHRGIGSKLVAISLQKALRQGYSAVFITGDSNYYSRFGFETASKYNIHIEGIPLEEEADFFMVKQLTKNALDNVRGYFNFDSCYNVDDYELELFDKKFPIKKKEIKPGQLKI